MSQIPLALTRAQLGARRALQHGGRDAPFRALARPPLAQAPEEYLRCAPTADALTRRLRVRVVPAADGVHVFEEAEVDEREEPRGAVEDVEYNLRIHMLMS